MDSPKDEHHDDDDDKPKESDSNPEHISLKVVGQDGNEVFFKIKKDTPLRKLMDAYCKRCAVERTAIRFLYDGERLDGTSSATELGMTDEDIIDVVLQQTGG